MSKKPNFWKLSLGLAVVALLFVGTWASTHAGKDPTTNDKGSNVANNVSATGNPVSNPRSAQPDPQCTTPAWDEVFEIDENAEKDGTTTEDWNVINPADGLAAKGPAGNAIVRTFVPDPSVRSDLIYTGGSSKDFNDVSEWQNVARGTGPDKDDIQHAYAAKYIVSDATSCNDGHEVIVFGGERPTSHGDANIGFWFFQNPVFAANGQFLDCDPTDPSCTDPQPAHHENGDVFVLSEFSGGGGQSFIRVLIWVGDDPNTAATECTNRGGTGIDPKSNGTLCELPASSLSATGVTNTGDALVDWPYTNKDNKVICTNANGTDGPTGDCTVPTPDFFEGAIDITELGLASECFSSFLLETRSSSEVSAVLKDFALGQFEACRSTCTKTVSPTTVCDGTGTTYTYSITNAGGANISITEVRDDNATASPTTDDFFISGLTTSGGTCTTTPVASGAPPAFNLGPGQTASCTLAATPGPGVYTNVVTYKSVSGNTALPDCSATATLTVNAQPSLSINNFACNTTGLASQLTVTDNNAAGGTLNWAKDGVTGFAGNVGTINVTLPGVYSVTSTTTAGCSGSASRTVGICTTCAP